VHTAQIKANSGEFHELAVMSAMPIEKNSIFCMTIEAMAEKKSFY